MSKGLFHDAIMESGEALLPDLISSSFEVVYTVSDFNYPRLKVPNPQIL
jgi:hypothetical protein